MAVDIRVVLCRQRARKVSIATDPHDRQSLGPGWRRGSAWSHRITAAGSAILTVPVPVSNIVGVSGNTGLAKVASAQPDGYTVGVITGLSISSWAAGMGRLNVNDFAYLGVVQASPSMLFVVIDSPIKNYQQLLDAAKANPGKLKVATAGFGSTTLR